LDKNELDKFKQMVYNHNNIRINRVLYGCRNITEEIELEQFLSSWITVVELTDDIMKMTGALKRRYRKAYEKEL